MGIKNKGFTIIEIVIVIGIISLIIPAIFSLFFATLRTQSKVLITQEVKRNGDDALSVIESLIKQNAISVHDGDPPTSANKVCDTNAPTPTPSFGTINFKDKDGTWFSFDLQEGQIASNSASMSGTTPHFLTNDKVTITNLIVTCNYVSDFSPPIISVAFTVSQVGPTGRPEKQATLNYQTKIKLRSY